MWHNAHRLNALANALFVAAAVLALALFVRWVLHSVAAPVRVVTVVTKVQHLDAESLRTRLAGHIAGNVLRVDLDDVRRRIESAPWVRRAAVRHAWPDRLIVEVEEHRALARWSDGELVNTYGELFAAATDAPLPRLVGPLGTEREMARRYAAFREIVAPLGTTPAQVTLSPRLAWQVRLANGMVLELGRDEPREPLEARLARFVAAFPQIAAHGTARVARIDLRYANGFAIRVSDRQRRAGVVASALPNR